MSDLQRENSEINDARERRLANLKPWKPGQSGNPRGRPKSRTLSEAYRRALSLPIPGDPEGRTYADAAAEMLAKEAAAGNVAAAKELADRTEGRPKQTVDVTVDERKRELYENAIGQLIAEAEEA